MSNQLLDDNRPPVQPKLYTAGEKLTASKLNKGVRAFQGLTTGVRPPTQVLPQSAAVGVLGLLVQMKVVSVSQDYVVCDLYDGVETGERVFVAKPFLLRSNTSRVVLDRNGDDVTLTYSAYAADGQSRTTTRDDDATQFEIVTPQYAVNDIIYAIKDVVGGTATSYTDTDGQAIAINWLDVNLDSREWCRRN